MDEIEVNEQYFSEYLLEKIGVATYNKIAINNNKAFLKLNN